MAWPARVGRIGVSGARITGGNLRLVQRLFSQIDRILEINELTAITKEVVDTAREALIIGPR